MCIACAKGGVRRRGSRTQSGALFNPNSLTCATNCGSEVGIVIVVMGVIVVVVVVEGEK